MRGSPYRSQGDRPNVRVVLSPPLEPWHVTAMVVLALLTVAALVVGLKTQWWGLLPLWATPLALLIGKTAGRRYEVLIDELEVRLRRRRWMVLWSEQRWPRTEVTGVRLTDLPNDMRMARGDRRLVLELRSGDELDVLEGYAPEGETAGQMRVALERALDPLELEALAEEHPPDRRGAFR